MTLVTKKTLPVMALSFLVAGIAHAQEAVDAVTPEAATMPETTGIEAVAPHAATAEHHSAGLPQLDPTSWPSQAFWLAVFFVILYTAYAKFILPAIGGTIEARRKHIADQMAAAENLTLDAQKLRLQVDAGLKAASQTAGQLMHTAENTAKTNITSATANFRDRFEAEVAQTEARLSAAKIDAMKDMQKMAATLASQAAEKIAGITTDAAQAEAVIEALTTPTKKAA